MQDIAFVNDLPIIKQILEFVLFFVFFFFLTQDHMGLQISKRYSYSFHSILAKFDGNGEHWQFVGGPPNVNNFMIL